MRIGVLLPSFADLADEALAVAKQAEDLGLHGVFAYDHLWPMGEPGKPAISPYPLLGAVAAVTKKVCLGTLVARVGLVPDDVLISQLLTLDALSQGRLIAGVGTGDSKSAAENLAYGIPMAPMAERLSSLQKVVTKLVSEGVESWVGAGRPETNAMARKCGATLNLWGVPPSRVGEEARLPGQVSWAGVWPKAGISAAARRFNELIEKGATWAVVTCPGDVELIAVAANHAGVVLGS